MVQSKSVIGLLFAAVAAVFPVAAQPRVAGFYVGYGASAYPPSAVDFTSMTQINMFSVLPKNDGTLDTAMFIDSVNGPAVAKDIAARAHAAGKKAILVVGGAGTEAPFHCAASSTYMNTFVQNLVNTVNAWGYDGLDIDWEPLSSGDYPTVLSLISNLRAAKPGIIITADAGWLNSNFALSSTDAQFYVSLGNAVDQLNLMTYGMADNWGGWVSWHSSATYGQGSNHPSSVSSTVNGYLNAGVPAAKLSIGIGFYGSCWTAPVTAPLQSPGTSAVVASDNTMGFASIMNTYYTAAAYHVDAAAQAPYLSFPTATGPSGCTFISYEDESSVAQKAQYVSANGLGGAIIWQINEAYNPVAADPSSLLHAVGNSFLGASTTVATTTTLGGSPNPAVVGQAVTFSASVAGADGGVPTGTVTFRDGATTLGSAVLNNGTASLAVATLAVGSHTVTAVYGGSAAYRTSTSAALSETVTRASTTTSLTSSVSPTSFGQATVLSAIVAVVAPGSGTPTGSVTFLDGATTLGSAALSGGKASLSVASLAVGSHSLTAVYAGVTNYASSTSAATVQTVNKANTTSSVVSSLNPAGSKRKVTFTATVAVVSPGAGTPTGTVAFYDGAVQLGTATLSAGKASLTMSSLAVGSHSITSSYAGTAGYAGSTSAALVQVVN